MRSSLFQPLRPSVDTLGKQGLVVLEGAGPRKRYQQRVQIGARVGAGYGVGKQLVAPADANHGAIVRNNWLFTGSLRAGQRAAAVMSLIQHGG